MNKNSCVYCEKKSSYLIENFVIIKDGHLVIKNSNSQVMIPINYCPICGELVRKKPLKNIHDKISLIDGIVLEEKGNSLKVTVNNEYYIFVSNYSIFNGFCLFNKDYNIKLKYRDKVKIKNKEDLMGDGFDVCDDGVYKNGKMYMNKSDMNFLGLIMEVEYKDSDYYKNYKYRGYSLKIADFDSSEVEMYNIHPEMFYLEKNN